MRSKRSCKSSDSMRNNGLRGKFPIPNGIKHCCMCTKETAPTHSNTCEYSYGIAIQPSL